MIDYLDYPINWKAIINKIFCKVIRQKINIQRAINSSFVHQQQTVRKCNRKRYWGFSSRSKCVPVVRLSPTEIYHWITARHWIPKDPHMSLIHTTVTCHEPWPSWHSTGCWDIWALRVFSSSTKMINKLPLLEIWTCAAPSQTSSPSGFS